MKHTKNIKNLYNNDLSNNLTVIFGIPFLTWPISTLTTFSGLEKVSLLLISIVILLGLKMIYSGATTTPSKKPFSKRRYAIADLNFKASSVLSPQIIVTLVLAGISGGLFGYYFLKDSLLILISSGITFFTIVLGAEYMYQDLAINIYAIKDKNFISFLYRKLKASNWINKYLLSCIAGIIGFILYKNIYPDNLSNILLGAALFVIIAQGIKAFYSK
jgi:hypothetical protein